MRFPAERVCAESALAAEKQLEGDRFAVSSIGWATKMEKNYLSLDNWGGLDVRIGSDSGLERFQAQPKWQIPDYL
jgi:hypothetical protein